VGNFDFLSSHKFKMNLSVAAADYAAAAADYAAAAADDDFD
jgi:hypothetical protein